MKIIKYFFLFIAVFFSSCKKDVGSFVNADFGYNYFPTKTKNYIIYDVDSIVHNDFTNKVDTFKFQVKEFMDTSFKDNSGRNTLRIEHYRKNHNDSVSYSLMPWTLTNVYYANRTSTSVERVEENQRYVKLVFPIQKQKAWNINVYNTLGDQECNYTDVNSSKTIGNFSYDSTLVVTQFDSENLIEKKYYVEVYAKNIGMVYKQIIDIKSNNITPGTPIMNRITSGVEYKMMINSHGSN